MGESSKTYDEYILEIDGQVGDIISRAQAYMMLLRPEDIREHILQAYEFAKEAHKKDVRLSWEPYISHPVAATEILLGLNPDISTIQACLMHDVIEDTPFTYEDIEEGFGTDVADLCAGMSKLEKVKYRGEERAIGSLRKMFIAMADDIRVIFIKLSDRLHNMQTLMNHPKAEKRERIAQETLNIYVPIAARLGLYKLKQSLEEECFKLLHPAERQILSEQLEDIAKGRKEFQNTAIITIGELLAKHDIPHKVAFRVKSPYSIYQKMLRKHIEHPADLYDIYGVRIIVPTVGDCYRVLWEIHSAYHTLPSRFKDYIALPKPNGYQSLHTTIIGFLKNYTKQPTEIQIRTEEMNTHAEIWVAAHFEYKEKGSKIGTEVNWVKDLKEIMENVGNSDLMSSLKIDTFKNRIFVFTPKGDPINLPLGSTPVDFAYHVHTELGDHIAIAKVNGVVHPLDKELQNGDVIEIIIDKNRKPSPFWLGYVKTIKAKNAIRAYLRKGDKELHQDRGKEIMNRYLEKSDLPVFDKDLTLLKVIDGRELDTQERLQLLEQVGNFSITPASLLKRIFKAKKISYQKKQSEDSNQESVAHEFQQQLPEDRREVVIGGEDNIPYKTCQSCCKNGIPDSLVAHINSRGMFTLHERNCTVLKGVNKDRLMNAYIKGEESTSLFRLSLILKNKIGMVKTISETLYSMEINIDELHTKKLDSQRTALTLGIEIPDYEYLIVDRFIERIKYLLAENLISYKIQEIEMH
jgi:guanosine-3',5'-bis(diphosphate) 3'-pyrophosphohydrolase